MPFYFPNDISWQDDIFNFDEISTIIFFSFKTNALCLLAKKFLPFPGSWICSLVSVFIRVVVLAALFKLMIYLLFHFWICFRCGPCFFIFTLWVISWSPFYYSGIPTTYYIILLFILLFVYYLVLLTCILCFPFFLQTSLNASYALSHSVISSSVNTHLLSFNFSITYNYFNFWKFIWFCQIWLLSTLIFHIFLLFL